MKFGLFKIFVLVSVVPLAVALNACGDDSSTSSPAGKLPTEVKDLKELEEHKCDMSVIGEKVFVESEDLLYECDGEKWFKSYFCKVLEPQESDGSSDSKNSDKDGSSSSDATTSSSSAKSSSSRPTEILEPEITVNETCTEVGACDAMVKTDISTWHFVRKDNFGDDAEYTYTVDGKDLIVTIKSADGSTDSKTYSMYNMESEAGVEMAFNAAKSTCKNGGGNDNKVKSCVKDTVKALPECDVSREGFIGKKDSSSYVVCKNGSWEKAKEIDMDTYGKTCTNAEVGTRTNGVVTDTNKYYCTANGWVSLMGWNWDVPKEAYFNPNITYGSMTDERDGKVYRTVQIGDQIWMAENLNYDYNKGTARSYCYDYIETNCAVTGRLYTWAAAIDSVALANDAVNPQTCGYGKTCTLPSTVQGICPEGWHLPSTSEWRTLFDYVGTSSTAGTALKSTSGWNDDGNGDEAYGFAVLPAGYRDNYDCFSYAGDYAYIWSSTEDDSGYAYRERFYYDYSSVIESHSYKDYAFSVRCLRN